MTQCYASNVTPGAHCLNVTVALLSSVAGVQSGPSIVSGPVPVLGSLADAHDVLDGLSAAVRGGKRDLVELKTRAARLASDLSRAQHDPETTDRISQERAFVLDEVASLEEVLPAFQAQRHCLANEVHRAEQTYRACLQDTAPAVRSDQFFSGRESSASRGGV